MAKKFMSFGDFVSHVVSCISDIDKTIQTARTFMIANALCDNDEHFRMGASLLGMIIDNGLRRISTTVDMKDVDKPEEELVDVYMGRERGLSVNVVAEILYALRKAVFKNRKYFESRDNVKYKGDELKEPVNELLKRHVDALKKVFENVGRIFEFDERELFR